MRVFVAGATGTLGRPVVRALVARGHEVTGLTRSERRRSLVESLGAQAVVGDALDPQRILELVTGARPEVVVHLLTALPSGGPLRPSHLNATNTLRVSGTAHLLGAAITAGARRLVAESFVSVYGATRGERVFTEDDPLPPVPDGMLNETVAALRSLEDELRTARWNGQIDTVSLRLGLLYGPDVPSTESMLSQARAGRLFLPRHLSGVGPFLHIGDAASAIVAAIEASSPSPVYNIVDNEAVSFTEFATLLARAAGIDRLRTLPTWLVRIAAPLMAEMASSSLRLSNAKARSELGWAPRYPRVADGLRDLATRVNEAA